MEDDIYEIIINYIENNYATNIIMEELNYYKYSNDKLLFDMLINNIFEYALKNKLNKFIKLFVKYVSLEKLNEYIIILYNINDIPQIKYILSSCLPLWKIYNLLLLNIHNNQHYEIFLFILTYVDDFNNINYVRKGNIYNINLFTYACKYNNIKIMEYLLDNNYKNINFMNEIIENMDDYKVIFNKIYNHSDFNIYNENEFGQTYLMKNIHNYDKLYFILHHFDIHINYQNSFGITLLIYACQQNCLNTIDLLLSIKNIHLFIKDKMGYTSYEYAYNNKHNNLEINDTILELFKIKNNTLKYLLSLEYNNYKEEYNMNKINQELLFKYVIDLNLINTFKKQYINVLTPENITYIKNIKKKNYNLNIKNTIIDLCLIKNII